MQFETFLPFAGLCAVVCFSPGPSTILAGSLGANYGLRKSLQHCAGTGIGYGSLIAVSILAIGRAVDVHPALETGAALIGAAILLWVAWKITNSGAESFDLRKPGLAPLKVWESVALQWVNPKAWAASSALASQVVSHSVGSGDKALAVTMLLLFAFVACLTWATVGRSIAAFLNTRRRQRVFNCAMGLGLAAVTMPLLLMSHA